MSDFEIGCILAGLIFATVVAIPIRAFFIWAMVERAEEIQHCSYIQQDIILNQRKD